MSLARTADPGAGPDQPAASDTERVTFASDGIDLVGELRLPPVAGPAPAVALTGAFTGVKDQVAGGTPNGSPGPASSRSPSTIAASARAAVAGDTRTARASSPTCGLPSRRYGPGPRWIRTGSDWSASVSAAATRYGRRRKTPG